MQHVAAAEARAHEEREQPVAHARFETGDVAPQHHALEERGDEGARPEEPVPQLAVPAERLHAQLERDPAQHQAHEHRDHRQVERGQHDAVRSGERSEEDAHAQHEPGLVGVPEGPDRGDHHRLLVFGRGRHQHADAEVEAVEQHDTPARRRP
jgi:hypothetical protein